MAAFAHLAVVGRGSNTRFYVIAIFTMCKTIASDLLEHSCEDVQFLKNIVTGGRVLGLRVRPGDKTAIVTVEGSLVSAIKNGAPGAKQIKGHITGVF